MEQVRKISLTMWHWEIIDDTDTFRGVGRIFLWEVLNTHAHYSHAHGHNALFAASCVATVRQTNLRHRRSASMHGRESVANVVVLARACLQRAGSLCHLAMHICFMALLQACAFGRAW